MKTKIIIILTSFFLLSSNSLKAQSLSCLDSCDPKNPNACPCECACEENGSEWICGGKNTCTSTPKPTPTTVPGDPKKTLGCLESCDPKGEKLCPDQCPCSNISGDWICSKPTPPPPADEEPSYISSCPENSIDTAIGCIGVDETGTLIQQLLVWSFGIGGGIFLLLAIYAGFTMMTSTGDPRKLQRGNEILFSAIAGLLFLVLSVFLLHFIGVDLLGILL